jgi:predicted component of type VI protein secretion system
VAEWCDAAKPHDRRDSPSGEEWPLVAEAFLDFLNAGEKVRPYRVTREVTLIGSGNGVKIHLTHPSVSTAHCSVVRTATGVWIVDLLSAEGTIVNGRVEPLAALKPGDEFQVGRFLIAVHYEHAEDAAQPSPQRHAPNGQPVKPALAAARPRAATHRVSADSPPGGQSRNGKSPTAANSSPDPARDVSPAESTPPLPGDGLSEQIMLNMVHELGAMQQQFLRQVQDSLRETLVQFTSAYEQRLDALERAHAALRDQLIHHHAPSPMRTTADPRASFESPRRSDPPTQQANGSQTARVAPMTTAAQAASGMETAKPTRNGGSVSGQHHPELCDRSGPHVSAHVPSLSEPPLPSPADVNIPADADDRARWIREQIKSIEHDLETNGRGWEKKLVELLGQ